MAGYRSEFPESVEDGSGTTVDGSVEATLRSASIASIQFFLVITWIQARRLSEWSPVVQQNSNGPETRPTLDGHAPATFITIARDLSEALYFIGVFHRDTHRNIGYKPIGLAEKTFIAIWHSPHQYSLQYILQAQALSTPFLFPNTAERLFIYRLDGMPGVLRPYLLCGLRPFLCTF